MNYKIGDYIKVYYEDGYSIGIISPHSLIENGYVTHLWIHPLVCESKLWDWVKYYIGKYRICNKGGLKEVSQGCGNLKIRKLTKDEIMVELL